MPKVRPTLAQFFKDLAASLEEPELVLILHDWKRYHPDVKRRPTHEELFYWIWLAGVRGVVRREGAALASGGVSGGSAKEPASTPHVRRRR